LGCFWSSGRCRICLRRYLNSCWRGRLFGWLHCLQHHPDPVTDWSIAFGRKVDIPGRSEDVVLAFIIENEFDQFLN
jgi:hypothetical protein